MEIVKQNLIDRQAERKREEKSTEKNESEKKLNFFPSFLAFKEIIL